METFPLSRWKTELPCLVSPIVSFSSNFEPLKGVGRLVLATIREGAGISRNRRRQGTKRDLAVWLAGVWKGLESQPARCLEDGKGLVGSLDSVILIRSGGGFTLLRFSLERFLLFFLRAQPEEGVQSSPIKRSITYESCPMLQSAGDSGKPKSCSHLLGCSIWALRAKT